jgi:phosphoribosyl-ATP pyrophosphohydrolase
MAADGPGRAAVLHDIEAVLAERLATRPAGSYSLTLLTDIEKMQRKLVEETFELCLELGRRGRADFAAERVAEEAADVVFHVLAGLVAAGVPLDDVLAELDERRGAGG